MILTVYLDSGDYSTLSNPRQQSKAVDKLRETLTALAASGRVRFAFSGTQLSEMSPVEREYTSSASERADLLVALCGRTALISFDRLMAMESARLADANAPPVDALSEDGTWFPELKDIVGPVAVMDTIRDALANTISDGGYNSRQRRQLTRALFREDGQPRHRLRLMLAQLGAQGDVGEVLRQYPMRPEDMQVLWRYVAGQAGVAEAERAFLESLRDPHWMMRWFEQHHAKLSPVIQWVRSASREFVGQFQQVIPEARALVDQFPAARDELLTNQKWRELEGRHLLQMANKAMNHWHPGAVQCEDVNRVDELCPGLSITVRTLHRIVRDAVAQQPRNLRESDLVDAMHAMYSPYVDVFRADRYMAPHIGRLASRWNTTIVGRLVKLPWAIEERLAQE